MPGRAMIIVAGGASSRFGGDKLMTPILGLPLVIHTMAAVSRVVDRCVLVCREDQVEDLQAFDRQMTVVAGGATRTGSELAGLAALGSDVELVGIHDGARPLVSAGLIEQLFDVAAEIGGAVPLLTDAPLVTRSGLAPVPGAGLAQTPQVFQARALIDAYKEAEAQGFEGHDTAEVVSAFSDLAIGAVQGDPSNIKVTFPADLERVISALEASRNEPR